MKKVLLIIGICVAVIGIATVTYTSIDAPKTYAMSITDMQAVNGGDQYYENQKCFLVSQTCSYPCVSRYYSQCEAYYPNHLCVSFSGTQVICEGDVSCQRIFGVSGGCVSYPD